MCSWFLPLRAASWSALRRKTTMPLFLWEHHVESPRLHTLLGAGSVTHSCGGMVRTWHRRNSPYPSKAPRSSRSSVS
jgi:hypothetical protein